MEKMINKYCLVRGDHSGVFAGIVRKVEGQQVLIEDVRRIWRWSGAASLSQLAAEGSKDPDGCNFTVTLSSILILDAIEVIPCTDEGARLIKAVPEWKM